jgi:uncharacterized protein (DUF1800 family)
VLDIVASHPATARYIARKLCVRFVSDSPPPALVDRASATFTRTGGDIREVVRTIVTSKEFFSREAYRTKVKSPFELVVSALRAVNAGADTTARSANAVAQLGEPLFGHVAPNGYPETGEAWINAGAILNRINYGMAVVSGGYPSVSIATLPYSTQPDSVVGAVLHGEVSPDTRRILTSGVNPLVPASGQLQAGSKGSLGMAKTVGLALGAPEFQRH